MAEFTTITLNPAVDRTEYLREFAAGGLNRPYRTVISAGGKGINLSRALNALSAKVNTISFAGGKTGEILSELLEKEGLAARLLPSAFETRMAVKLAVRKEKAWGKEIGKRSLTETDKADERARREAEESGKALWAAEESERDGKAEKPDAPGMSGRTVTTEINEEGHLSEREIAALVEEIAEWAAVRKERTIFGQAGEYPEDEDPHVVFLCGSFPQGVEKNVYNFLITLLEGCGFKTVVDTSGEGLVESLKASPSLIKPNEEELFFLHGGPFTSEKELVDFCRELYVDNNTEVLCTLGEKGSLFVGKEGIFRQVPKKVFPYNPTGAGDSFLAAFAYGRYEQKKSPADALAFAEAFTEKLLAARESV